MNKILNKILLSIPYFLIGVSALSGYFSSYEFYKPFRLNYLGDLSGYSIVTGLFMFLTFYRFKRVFCLHTRISAFILILMNIISLSFNAKGIYYNPIYDFYIGVFVCVITLFIIYDFYLPIKSYLTKKTNGII